MAPLLGGGRGGEPCGRRGVPERLLHALGHGRGLAQVLEGLVHLHAARRKHTNRRKYVKTPFSRLSVRLHVEYQSTEWQVEKNEWPSLAARRGTLKRAGM